jgi:hypothetical protein
MVGAHLITELVNTIFLTGSLKEDPPQSLLLIASPESGKTSFAKRENQRSVLYISDGIGSGILEELAAKPYIRHIVINDMVMIMAHKEVTNRRTLAVIMALTEDGLSKIIMPGQLSADFGGRRAGFICCAPSGMVKDERRWWNTSGFSSRVIPFNYEYTHDLQIQIIKQTVINGAYEKRNGLEKIVVPSSRITVEIPDQEAIAIQKVADFVATKIDEKGIRRGKQFRALARAHAILREGKQAKVTKDDILFLKKISGHISYTNPKELKYEKEK